MNTMHINWLLAVVGLALVTWSLAILWCGWASRRWPIAVGAVMTGDIQHGRNRSGPYYVAEISYEYVVGRRRLSGTRRRF